MKLVVVESPYAGDVEANVAYARRCFKDCLDRGESPYASHLLFTQPGILDDTKMEERMLGIRAGFAWAVRGDVTGIYVDRGISTGMSYGALNALQHDRPIEIRSIERFDRSVQKEMTAVAAVELGVVLRLALNSTYGKKEISDEELARPFLVTLRELVARFDGLVR